VLHIFLDTGVWVAGLTTPDHPARVVLALANRRAFSPVMSRRVLWELEQIDARRRVGVATTVHRFLEGISWHYFPLATPEEIDRYARGRIRHVNDWPVLAAAILAQPDLVISDNDEDFTPEVERVTGLRILTSREFMAQLQEFFEDQP
jgi:predicted nucleic acid-binding protein